MHDAIILTIPGEPTGKGRPRFNSKTRRTYTPSKTVKYEDDICTIFKDKYGRPAPLTGELRAEINAYMKIPKKTSKRDRAVMMAHGMRPIKTPDADNIAKAILDALNGLAYEDDKQVVDCRVQKFYSDEPRVEVRISEIDTVGKI